MSAGLQVGDDVIVEVNGRQSIHAITARRVSAAARTSVEYRLMPALSTEWVDSDLVRKAKGFGSAVNRKRDPFEIAE